MVGEKLDHALDHFYAKMLIVQKSNWAIHTVVPVLKTVYNIKPVSPQDTHSHFESHGQESDDLILKPIDHNGCAGPEGLKLDTVGYPLAHG